MMKSYWLALAACSLSIFAFSGCANEQSKSTANGANPTDRTYTRKDLQNTGRQDTGSAAQAVDPAVSVSSGRH